MFVWAGTSDSLHSYLDLAKKFEAKVELQVQSLSARANDDKDYRLGDNLIERHGSTAVLYITGGLVNSHAWWHDYVPGEVSSYDAIKSAVNTLIHDETVGRVVVKFDSPGGQVKGVQTAANALSTLSKAKPTQAQATMACSAGYWLASSVPSIKAEEMAQIGNIGTLAVIPDLSEMFAKEGVKFHVFKAGKYKNDGDPRTPFTEEEKARIQEHVEKSNNFFLTTVSKNRNLMLSERETWGEAQTFFAGEAKAVGLIDGIATLEDVVGSQPAAQSTHQGGPQMVISEDKLAAIAAGAAPETVLSADELAMYHSQLNAEVEPTEGGQTPSEPEAGEEGEGEPAEGAPEANANVGTEHLALAKELGKVEAKLEATQAALQAKEEAVASMKAQMEGLLVVAQAAVGNLQVALQQPKEAKGTAAEVIAQYNDLQGQMKKRFPQGRQSSTAADTKEPLSASANFHPFRPV